MAQPKIAMWGFVLAGVLFVAAALMPMVRGGTLNATFLALSVVFFILGAAVAKKGRPTDSNPPGA
jgi:hypothetical protein